MNILNRIFGIPEIEAPFKVKEPAKVKKEVFEKDVQFLYGKPFKQVDTKDGFELSMYQIVQGRTDKITDNDQYQIKYRQLKTDKYMKIKFSWARGLSVRQLTKELSTDKGFSKTIIAQYFAAINEANPSPH